MLAHRHWLQHLIAHSNRGFGRARSETTSVSMVANEE